MRAGRALVALLALLAPLAARVPPSPPSRFTFIKVFPGSVPEYTALTVSEDGTASYDGRALNQSAQPENFRLPPELVAQLFARAAELNYFRDLKLDSPRKIANLGEKTLRWQAGELHSEVRYNYTQNPTAAALQELCEKIARGRYYVAQLEFRLKFDRLGVLDTLREVERHFNSRAFVHFEQFVPVLNSVAQDRRVVQLARTRSERLLERIRGAPARVHFEQVSQQPNSYVAVSLREDGPASYEVRRLNEPSHPLPLEVSAGVRARVFELLREASYLRDLGSAPPPPALTAGFRLTYEAASEYNQASFTTPPTPALADLVRLFSQVLTQREFRARLTRALREARAELPAVLYELEQAVRQRALIEPAEFVPLLEKVAQGGAFYREEQALARKILEQIGAGGAR